MRKITVLLILMALMLSASLVQAAPPDDLNALARFFPADSIFVVSIRIDDGYVDTLDGLIERIMRFAPEDQQIQFSIRDTLNQAFSGANLGTFDEIVRPWLGNTLSISVRGNQALLDNTTPDVLIAVAVEGSGARAFFDQVTAAQSDVVVMESNGMKMYMQADEEVFIGITADTLFLSSTKAGLPIQGVQNPISAEPIFAETLTLLPESDYNITIFINTPLVQRLAMESIQQESGQALPEYMQNLLTVNSAQMIGFTILGDSTLTIDIAQQVDSSAMSNLGVEMPVANPLDPGFVNRIPAGTPLAIAIADFGPLLQSGYTNLQAAAEAIKQQGGLIPLLEEAQIPLSESDYQTLQSIDPIELLATVNATFAAATGLNLQDEFLPVFDGDAALYLRAIPAQDFIAPIVPEMGFIAEASNGQGAQAVVDALTRTATGFEINATTETFGSGSALVIPSNAETTGFAHPALDVVVGAGNGLLMVGTRGAAESVLNGSEGLADDPIYQAASAYFLPQTQVMLYLSGAPLLDVVDQLLNAQLVPVQPDTEGAYALFSVVESASITSAASADGVTLIRLALTLAEQPRPFPFNQ
jgi:hypothetical protein